MQPLNLPPKLMKKLLLALWLSTLAAVAFAQASVAAPAPAEAASSPAHVKPKHRKPMHVEPTQPKTKKHHSGKAKPPAPQASAAE